MTLSCTTLLASMIPADQPNPGAKRKATDESNPLLAAKRAKKEAKGASNKRKLFNAEETPGGLLVVRTQESTRPPASQPSTLATHDKPPSSSSLRPSSQPVAGPSKPPSKKFRAGSQPPQPQPPARSTSRQPTIHEDPQVEEDVRAMDDEADHLRRLSRARTVIDPSILASANPPAPFQFPLRPDISVGSGSDGARGGVRTKGKSRLSSVVDSQLPIPENETPQIQRNKMLREGAMSAIGAGSGDGKASSSRGRNGVETSHRRKSSLSRGKRISTSYEATGVITQPHNSVSTSSFYKHIDADLPDSERIRQLLIWCALRVSGSTLGSSTGATPAKSRQSDHASPSSSTNADPPLPPLSAKAQLTLRTIQDEVIKMLADKKINLSLYGPGTSDDLKDREMKENEQNVRNRNLEVVYTGDIQQAQAEEETWKKISYEYEAYAKKVRADIEKQALPTSSTSSKAEGKRRATGDGAALFSDDLDALNIHELPEEFRRGAELAKEVLLSSAGRDLDERIAGSLSSTAKRSIEIEKEITSLLPDVRFKIDRLYSFVSAARETTNMLEALLDDRFNILNDRLAKRHQLGVSSLHHPTQQGATQTLNAYVKKDHREGSAGVEPVSLLRALSRVDIERPPEMIGDAARKAAREVQRVEESGLGAVAGERKLTGLPPSLPAGSSTPRKALGTPRREKTPIRRGGTPGKER